MQISESGKEPNGNSLPLAADWQVEGDGGKRPPGSSLLKGGGGAETLCGGLLGAHHSAGERLSRKPHSGLDLEPRLTCEYSGEREERAKIKD